MIYLKKATLKDRKKAYEWLYYSDYASSLVEITGSSDVPSFEEFCEDYENYFFCNSSPEKGRAYLIILKNGSLSNGSLSNGSKKNESYEEIGFISYTAFHLLGGIAELDIWLKSLKFMGKGYGTSALKILSEKLFENGFQTVIIRPSVKNTRAIRSYGKAGFEKADLVPEKFYRDEYIHKYASGDFGLGGDVFMVKKN